MRNMWLADVEAFDTFVIATIGAGIVLTIMFFAWAYEVWA